MTEKLLMEKKKLFTGKTNLEIMKCLVWSVALYVCCVDSTGTQHEMWIWRKMENNSWLDNDKVANQDGHVLRHNRLLHEI